MACERPFFRLEPGLWPVKRFHPPSLSLLLSHFSSAKELGIVASWGQNVRERELDEACATGNYEIVNIAFLCIFGNGQTPDINLSGHCSECWGAPCTKYASQIAYCQSKDVKIFLSFREDSRRYSLSSGQDAKRVADYLWTNFLGGHQNNSEGLLGNTVLDDIALGIKQGGTYYHDDLARELDSY
ncbi:acidic endochitinase-like [Neltuma alba]|uniref:acidic endochitinase-like n=1 Tax=Neltuma alba TaxID=207710 RepID=UPI0010A4F456|nr:acidic endochitinase-like [Prosopis alba]